MKLLHILDTLLHECAHAIETVRHGTWGHGPRWATICNEVGARPEPTKDVLSRNVLWYIKTGRTEHYLAALFEQALTKDKN